MSILLFFTFFVSFAYRIFGLWNNHPFWVDEFSSVAQAKLLLQYGLQVFTDKTLLFDAHNITTHFLIATSFKLFGMSEFTARLPNAFLGAIVPVAVFLVAKKIFGKNIALSAMILTSFSYFEIVWSRQARSYIGMQLLILLTIYFYLFILEKKQKIHYYIYFSICVILGILTHYLYFLFVLAIPLHVILFYKKLISWKKILPIIVVFLSAVIFFSISRAIEYFKDNLVIVNNLWYYHSFLWREYGLVTFLAVIGLMMGFLEQPKKMILLFFHIGFHLLFIVFLFPPYVSRYLLPIFPYLFIGMSYTIVRIAELISSNVTSILPQKYNKVSSPLIISLIISFAILANGYKFVNKPKQFYSVNHDFREIALIDYNQVYNLIKTKGRLHEGKTAVVDTWDARLYWYLGRNFKGRHIFRWQNEKGTVNGLSKQSDFIYNKEGEKVVPTDREERFIGELSDLKKTLKKYPRGFIFIDDASLPADVLEYVEKNFKKELYIDHYPLDDNPYSIWPATLYSWGV